MYAFPLRLYGRRMHMCNLKKSYYESADPFHQFFVQESQGNQEILKIFDRSSFVSLNGSADYPLENAICTMSEIQDFPKEKILPGKPDLQQAFIRMKIGPDENPSSGLLLKEPEANGSNSVNLLEGQLSIHKDRKSGLVIKKEKAKASSKQIDRIYLELEFQPLAEEPSYTCVLIIHILRKNKSESPLYRGIIDFGSDALQMRVINPHGKKDDIDILSKIAENFYGYEEHELRQEDRSKLFYQELPDESLFKSDIFIRNKQGVSTSNDAPGSSDNKRADSNSHPHRMEDTRELVNVLTSTQIEDLWTKNRFLAPNLKLAALKDFFNKRIQFDKEEDNPDPMGSKDVSFSQLNHLIYRIALNKFLHTLFLVIRKATREKISPYVHLTLLVPNVYRQSLIHDLIEGLLKDWQEALYNQYEFAGLEIQIMSESDATFLGMLHELEPEYQDQFLIIDGGKGTTDISIIRVDKENDEGDIKSYSSIYRGGFIGAGNLISYAFIETLLAIFYSEDANKRREFMETYLLSHSPKANLNEILEFLGLVEQLKISYHDPAVEHLHAHEIREHIKSAYLKDQRIGRLGIEVDDTTETTLREYIDKNESNTPLGTLNKWIINTFKIDNSDKNAYQKSFSLSDDFRFISEQVDSMAETFCQNLSELKIDGKKLSFKKILFAGRSFLFKDLLDKMKDKLAEFVVNEQAGEDNTFMTMAHNPKKVCLHGALGQQEVNHLSSLIGIPFVNQKQEKDNPSASTEQSRGEEKLVEDVKPSKNPPKFLISIREKVLPVLSWLKRNFLLSIHKSQLRAWNNRNISEVDINFFLTGSKIIPRGSQVFINGNKINLEKWMQGHDFKLFYGGEDFYCRILDDDGSVKETRKIEFQLEDTSQKDDLLIKSVFPFIELGGSHLPVSLVNPFLDQEKAEERNLETESKLVDKYLNSDPELPDIEDFFSAKNPETKPIQEKQFVFSEDIKKSDALPNGNKIQQNAIQLLEIDSLEPEIEQVIKASQQDTHPPNPEKPRELPTHIQSKKEEDTESKKNGFVKKPLETEDKEDLDTGNSSNILGV